MNLKTYLTHSRAGMSPSAAYLETRFPGQAILPVLAVAEILGMPHQTMRNRIMLGKFPIPSFKEGARRMCLKCEVVAYLDTHINPKPKRGAKTKAERIKAKQVANWKSNEGENHGNT